MLLQLLLLTYTFIQSYCGNPHKQKSPQLFLLQTRVMKYIENKTKRQPCRDIFKSNKVLNGPRLYIYETPLGWE